jgi:hypothetical protein
MNVTYFEILVEQASNKSNTIDLSYDLEEIIYNMEQKAVECKWNPYAVLNHTPKST